MACVSLAQRNVSENYLQYIGQPVKVTGKIYGGAFLVNVRTQPTFLNLGDTSPRHRLMIRIEPEDRSKFPEAPEKYFVNKIVTVSGTLQDYKGTPMITVSDPGNLLADSGLAANVPQPLIPGTNQPLAATSTSSRIGLPAVPLLKVQAPILAGKKEWIKSEVKRQQEEKQRDVRVVTKTLQLKTAPYKNAPLIAELPPGVALSILHVSKKYSYVSIGSVDGFNNVTGFIRKRNLKHLRKP